MARRALVVVLTTVVSMLAVPGISHARARATLTLQPDSGSGTSPVTATLRGNSENGCGASAAVFSWDGVRVAVAAMDRRNCSATVTFQPPAGHIKPGRHQVNGRLVGARGSDSATYRVDGSATSPSPTRHNSAAAVPPPPPVVVQTNAPTGQAPTDAGTKAAAGGGSGMGAGYLLGLLAVLAGAAVAGYALYLVFRDRSGTGNLLTRRFRGTVYGGPTDGADGAGYGPGGTGAMPAAGAPRGPGGPSGTAMMPPVRHGAYGDEAPATAVLPRMSEPSDQGWPTEPVWRRGDTGRHRPAPPEPPVPPEPSGRGWPAPVDDPLSPGWRPPAGDPYPDGGGWGGRGWADDDDRYPPRR